MINLLHKSMFYCLLWLMLSFLAACTSRYDAQVAQANAQQAQAQAAIIQAQKQAEMFSTLAESAKPVYWPIVVLVVLMVVAILFIVRWHMVTVSHVAAGQSVRADDLRLLPSDSRFFPALRKEARRIGADVEVSGADYYLITDGQRVKVRALIGE
jgi:hypothetical protein